MSICRRRCEDLEDDAAHIRGIGSWLDGPPDEVEACGAVEYAQTNEICKVRRGRRARALLAFSCGGLRLKFEACGVHVPCACKLLQIFSCSG